MKRLYTRLVLWLIRPALEARERSERAIELARTRKSIDLMKEIDNRMLRAIVNGPTGEACRREYGKPNWPSDSQ